MSTLFSSRCHIASDLPLTLNSPFTSFDPAWIYVQRSREFRDSSRMRVNHLLARYCLKFEFDSLVSPSCFQNPLAQTTIFSKLSSIVKLISKVLLSDRQFTPFITLAISHFTYHCPPRCTSFITLTLPYFTYRWPSPCTSSIQFRLYITDIA